MAAAEINVNVAVSKATQEMARALEDFGIGFTLAGLLKHSRTANDGAMRATLEGLTPEQRDDVACLGACLVELVNEIGSGEPEHAARGGGG